jgi:hypothetical protein
MWMAQTVKRLDKALESILCEQRPPLSLPSHGCEAYIVHWQCGGELLRT